MKPAPFDYARVERLEEALDLLRRYGNDARVLAGGQSLIAMLNMRLAQPRVLVDIMRLTEVQAVRLEKDTMVIPAAVRQAQLEKRESLAGEIPLLAKLLPWLGHPQTRARGTVCGSIAHADPSAELPLALVALDGEVLLRSSRRRRRIPAQEFFLGMMLTDKHEDELIEAVRIPLVGKDTGTAFREVGRRKGDFAIVSCAAVIRGDHTRLAVGGVNDTPVVRDWEALAPADTEEALNAFAWSLDARDDMHATAAYRRELVRKLGLESLQEARACTT